MQSCVVQGCVLIPTEGNQFELLNNGGPVLWMAQVEWCETTDLPMRANGVRTLEKLIRQCPTRCQGMDQRDPLKILIPRSGGQAELAICVRNIDGWVLLPINLLVLVLALACVPTLASGHVVLEPGFSQVLTTDLDLSLAGPRLERVLLLQEVTIVETEVDSGLLHSNVCHAAQAARARQVILLLNHTVLQAGSWPRACSVESGTRCPPSATCQWGTRTGLEVDHPQGVLLTVVQQAVKLGNQGCALEAVVLVDACDLLT